MGVRPNRPAPSGRGAKTRATHEQAVKIVQDKARIVARQDRAFQLFIEHATYQQIATQLRVSVYTAHHDVQQAIARLEAHHVGSMADLRMRMQANIDLVHRVCRGDLVSKDWKVRHAAIGALQRNMQREAELWGLDTKVQAGESAERVLALVKGLTDLFLEIVLDPTLQQRWVDGVRAKLRPQLAGELHVEAQVIATQEEQQA